MINDVKLQPIVWFSGAHAFLSNFSQSRVLMAGTIDVYAPTVEHAFQAQKMTSIELRDRVLACRTPGAAKKLARSLPCRADWEQIKRDVMKYYVRLKFSTNPYLLSLLAATGNRYLIEGNTWGDTTWGKVFTNGEFVGSNWLGLILMEIRSELCAVTQ